MSRALIALVVFVIACTAPAATSLAAGPEGQVTIARTESTAARWFDPAEMDGGVTLLTPCLAESWS